MMAFKDSTAQFQIINISLLDPDPEHARRNVAEESLKGLVNSIQKLGLIHPIVVRPAATEGRYTVIVGERRRQAAIRAGEHVVPVVIRACAADTALEVQVFENIGLGVRAALEPRDMANAIQTIAERFETPEAAAQHFGRAPTWLGQATAAANLSEKVTALLDSGKISSTGAAVQLERLTKKNEARAEALIDQIEQLPEGEKASKKVVDDALLEASGRSKKEQETPAEAPVVTTAPIADSLPEASDVRPPWEEAPAPQGVSPSGSPRTKVNPSKVKRVAELLGLSEENEEDLLVRLIDEFLAPKDAA
ncbi:ParB/RepB/Spo0J family partition protein [uncultured Propionivibrio sp.]|uniref:ParB/RepB/Spo0J family partition protein n=1 Tax=uncultured Propionivibrio sp. TaxID=426737 RepID=UPI0029C0B8EC|nr:ParB/RepB/Spo0J family partition protein [uncultured Propionivibrio sp.]